MNSFIYLIVFLISFLMYSCGKKSSEQQQTPGAGQPVPVSVAKVSKRDVTYFEKLPGTIVAITQVEIRSQVSGYVTGIHFKEGSAIKKGQLLYDIDKRKYSAAYEQAQANVQIAESNLAKAQKDVDRYTFLLKKDAIAKQKVDYAMTDLNNAKDQLKYAKQSMANSATDLSFAYIRSPLNGTIGVSQVRLGAVVGAGQTILNTVSTEDSIAFDFNVSQRLIPSFIEYQKNKSVLKDSIFTLVLPNDSIYEYPGDIMFFDRAVDPSTGTLMIRIKFYNPDHLLKVGMNCNVRIKNSSKGKVMVVPFKAVTEQMGEYFVYVSIKDTAYQKKVVPGNQIGNELVINSGIEEGDSIVIDGIQKLKQATPITKGPIGNKPVNANK